MYDAQMNEPTLDREMEINENREKEIEKVTFTVRQLDILKYFMSQPKASRPPMIHMTTHNEVSGVSTWDLYFACLMHK